MDYKLDFEQRNAAGVLAEEMACADDIEAYAFEIVALRARVKELEQWQRDMVRITAENRLEGYRELGQRAADAENARDDALAANATLTATVATLREALEPLYKACCDADDREELDEAVDGSLLDAARRALAATPEAGPAAKPAPSRLELAAIRYVDAETAYASCDEAQDDAAHRERDAAWQELICARANAAEPEADHTSVEEIKPCPDCGGNGSVPSRIMWGGGFSREACPTCNGTGIEPAPCPECEGDGCSRKALGKPCDTCNGTGKEADNG